MFWKQIELLKKVFLYDFNIGYFSYNLLINFLPKETLFINIIFCEIVSKIRKNKFLSVQILNIL